MLKNRTVWCKTGWARSAARAETGDGYMLCRTALERVRYEVMGRLRKPLAASNGRRAEAYLEGQGALALLRRGDAGEHRAVLADLAYLHRTVRRKKPKTIVEFGVGFSTLVMAHALHLNRAGRANGEDARLYTVDTSHHWIDNTRGKLPDAFKDIVELRHSEARLTVVNNELCHRFEVLPNVVPDLIYLDGPDPSTVAGDVCGLTHAVEQGEPRRAMSADVLLYESGLKVGAAIIVDNRRMNTRCLRRNLKRNWRFRANKAEGRFTFVLVD
ncbi:MAG: class I SAM-dependent methyltransferase [Hyphomicrobiales bacterium]